MRWKIGGGVRGQLLTQRSLYILTIGLRTLKLSPPKPMSVHWTIFSRKFKRANQIPNSKNAKHGMTGCQAIEKASFVMKPTGVQKPS